MKTLIFVLLLTSSYSWANSASKINAERAKTYIKKAVLSLPTVRTLKRQAEDYIVRRLPLNKPTLTLIGSATAPIVKGELNTKVIKKMDFNLLGAQIRPDVIYNFKNNTVRGIASIKWTF